MTREDEQKLRRALAMIDEAHEIIKSIMDDNHINLDEDNDYNDDYDSPVGFVPYGEEDNSDGTSLFKVTFGKGADPDYGKKGQLTFEKPCTLRQFLDVIREERSNDFGHLTIKVKPKLPLYPSPSYRLQYDKGELDYHGLDEETLNRQVIEGEVSTGWGLTNYWLTIF